jgi:hypothetical protein
MDIINCNDLQNNDNGSILFQDSESFLNDLTDNELVSIKGGAIDIGKLLEINSSDFLKLLTINEQQKSINGQTLNAHTASNINTV